MKKITNINNLMTKEVVSKKYTNFSVRKLLTMVYTQKLKLVEMQRYVVWNEKKQGNFLGNVIYNPNGIIFPIVIMTDGERSEVVDGQQRLSALLSFSKDTPFAKKLIAKNKSKHKNYSLLRVNMNEKPLKLNFDHLCMLNTEQQCSIKGATCLDFSDDIIDDILGREIPVCVIKVDAFNYDTIRHFYVTLNSGIEFKKEEIALGKFSAEHVYMTLSNIFHKELASVIKSKHKIESRPFMKYLNPVTDLFSWTIQKYTGGSSDKRIELYSSTDYDFDLKLFEKNFKKLMSIAKVLFTENNCFSEYDHTSNTWKEAVNSSIFSWLIALHNLMLVTDISDYKKFKNEIITNWKYMSISSGRKDEIIFPENTPAELKAFISVWCENKVDNTNNTAKVCARANAIEGLIRYSMNIK